MSEMEPSNRFKWSIARDYKKIYQFLGPQVVGLFVSGLFLGLAIFCVEIVLAYCVQILLVLLKISSRDVIHAPFWIPSERLPPFLAFISVFALARALLVWAQTYTSGLVQDHFQIRQRARLLEWLLDGSAVSTTHFLALFTDKMDKAELVLESLQQIVVHVVVGMLILGALAFTVSKSTLLLIAVLGALLLPVKLLNRWISEIAAWLTGERYRVFKRVVAASRNLPLLKIHGVATREKDATIAALRELLGKSRAYRKLAGASLGYIQFASIVTVCLFTIGTARTSGIHPGIIVTIVYLVNRVFQQVQATNIQLTRALYYLPALEDLAKWWADCAKDGIRGKADFSRPIEARAPRAESLIGWELQGVSFTHASSKDPLFRDLDLKIPAGAAVTITGASGAGKSTLIDLLLGVRSPGCGTVQVSYGGSWRSVEEARPAVLKSVGYVGAESFLIEGTIRENLIYGSEGQFTRTDIERALDLAACDFIRALPRGPDHLLTDQGHGLSAGQKQRICLARALLRRPMALILDEATANLDVKTERSLVQTLARLKGQFTLIAVTHKEALTSIADLEIHLEDRITVLARPERRFATEEVMQS